MPHLRYQQRAMWVASVPGSHNPVHPWSLTLNRMTATKGPPAESLTPAAKQVLARRTELGTPPAGRGVQRAHPLATRNHPVSVGGPNIPIKMVTQRQGPKETQALQPRPLPLPLPLPLPQQGMLLLLPQPRPSRSSATASPLGSGPSRQPEPGHSRPHRQRQPRSLPRLTAWDTSQHWSGPLAWPCPPPSSHQRRPQSWWRRGWPPGD